MVFTLNFVVSGKIENGDLLLEVNRQSVVGLTLYDLNSLIKQCRGTVHFQTVKEGIKTDINT